MGGEILFDASTSVDVAQQPGRLECRWDWNVDGDYDINWSSKSSANHSFSETGEFSVRVQARDSAGLLSEAETSVFVDTAIPEFSGVAFVALGILTAILVFLRTKR